MLAAPPRGLLVLVFVAHNSAEESTSFRPGQEPYESRYTKEERREKGDWLFYDHMANDGVYTTILQWLGNGLLPLNLITTKYSIRYPVAFS